MSLSAWPLVRKVVAIALAVEVFRSIAWITRLLSVAAIYEMPVFVMMALRAAVTALQISASFGLWRDVPTGRRLAEVALLLSAVLIVFETGLALSPSSTLPDFRWPIVVAYAAYALGAIVSLRVMDGRR